MVLPTSTALPKKEEACLNIFFQEIVKQADRRGVRWRMLIFDDDYRRQRECSTMDIYTYTANVVGAVVAHA